MKGGPFGDKRNFGKVAQGTLWTKFASLPGPDLALVGFRIVSKKWTDQCEDFSLKKQARNGPSRRHI